MYEMMSSEESGDSDEEDNKIIVKPLPWRSSRINNFFQSLDQMSKEGKSPQSLRQMKKRILGSPSTRMRPVGQFPSWAFTM